MSKRDIKAKRWEKRRFKKEHGLSWMFWYYALQAIEGRRIPARAVKCIGMRQAFICGRQLGMTLQRNMLFRAITGDAGVADGKA